MGFNKMPNFTRFQNNQTDRIVHRQSNFELLRIIAMIFIVAFHFSDMSGFEFSTTTVSINQCWIQLIGLGGKVGVNIFVLISGYFLISAKQFKTAKVIKLWLQLVFYSVVIYAIFAVMGIAHFGYLTLIKQFAPVIYSHWWFASTYFILYLFSPYINVFLKALTRKQYSSLLIFMFFIWCVIPTFTGLIVQSNALLWFVFLYSLAGYYKLYGFKKDLSSKALLFLSIISIFITYAITILLLFLGTKKAVFGDYAVFVHNMQTFPVFLISLLMFLGFSKLKIKNNKLINLISSATFGVYLIHNDHFVSSFLWDKVFKASSYSNSKMLIPLSLIAIGTVFVGCTFLELLRINLLEHNYMPLIDKLSFYVDKIRLRNYEKRSTDAIQEKET